jgi:S-formylglutathione hydrolase FrmB
MKKYFLLTIFIIGLFASTFSQQQFVLQSENLTKADTIWVFTPAGYADNIDKSYPAIYLLHGWSGTYHQWNDIINCQEYADEYGFVIICPDGLYDSWYINSPVPEENQFESFFVSDLLPFISGNFRIQQQNIFITGLSMGGHGAMYLYLRHSNRFAAAGSTSGVLNLNASSLKYSSLSNRLGEYKQHKKTFDSYSAIALLDSIKFTSKPIIFDCGNGDHLYQANKEFKDACDSLHVNAFYFSFPGRHNRAYWRESLPLHFRFFYQIYLLGLKE